MTNLLEFLLIHLVDHPEDVKVEEAPSEDHIKQYVLHVHPEDMGRVIGRRGSIINSIRNIAKIKAIREGVHINITLAEHEQQEEAQPQEEEQPVVEKE